MDTVEDLKAEAALLKVGFGSWRENSDRLIWCGRKDDGIFVFRNTVSPTRAGPIISECDAAKYLAAGGPWVRPSSSMQKPDQLAA
jgi:hypothetical protein